MYPRKPLEGATYNERSLKAINLIYYLFDNSGDQLISAKTSFLIFSLFEDVFREIRVI